MKWNAFCDRKKNTGRQGRRVLRMECEMERTRKRRDALSCLPRRIIVRHSPLFSPGGGTLLSVDMTSCALSPPPVGISPCLMDCTQAKKKKSLGKEERRERKRRDIVIKMMGGRALSLSCQGEEESHDIRQAGRMHAFFSLGDV